MFYEIEIDDLPTDKQADLNALLEPLNAELGEMMGKAGDAQRLLNEMDKAVAAKVKEVFDKAGEFAEAENLDDSVEDALRDQTHDFLYDWCSGRPLEFQLDSDGSVNFWEPSSC